MNITKNPNPKRETLRENRALEKMKRAHTRARVLAIGVSEELKRMYGLDEYKRILDLIATDLTPAMRDLQSAVKITDELSSKP